MRIIHWILCNILSDHDWTSANNEGIGPTQKQIDNGVSGFYDYAKMYCKRCGTLSKLNLKVVVDSRRNS